MLQQATVNPSVSAMPIKHSYCSERLHMALCQRFYALCKPVHITKPQQFPQMFPCGLVTIKNNKLSRQMSIMLDLLSFFQRHVFLAAMASAEIPHQK